ARAFYDDVFAGEFLVDMRFVQASGPDLTVEPHETWDLEILECQVPQDYDLKHLSDFLEQKGQEVYLRSEEHTSELQSRFDLVCRLLLEKKKLQPQRTAVR